MKNIWTDEDKENCRSEMVRSTIYRTHLLPRADADLAYLFSSYVPHHQLDDIALASSSHPRLADNRDFLARTSHSYVQT